VAQTPEPSFRDRLGARLVTGPSARGAAFLLDFTAALIRMARGNPEHPEERRVPKQP
jgi:hypothetical protein